MIRVKRGPYSRYKGKVVDARDKYIRLELEAQHKVVTVRKEHLDPSDQAVLDGSFRSEMRTPGTVAPYMQAGQMPMHGGYGIMGAVPSGGAYGQAYPQTPVGSMHGAPYGSRTPMHVGIGSQTPMHDGGYGNQTPMYHSGSRTPTHERSGAFNISQSPYRSSGPDSAPEINPHGSFAFSNTKRSLGANEVDISLLQDVVVQNRSTRDYARVTEVLGSTNRVKVQLGQCNGNSGFQASPDGNVQDWSVSDLDLAKPVINGSARIVKGANIQAPGEFSQVMHLDEDGALVRSSGDMGDVTLVGVEELAYVVPPNS